jgi:tetrahydromethanopterin S-methyltransferase subunit D
LGVAFSLALFGVGVALVIWATQRLLEGLVGLAWLLRVSAFAVAAILSGFEAENVAVGLEQPRHPQEMHPKVANAFVNWA